MHIQINISTRSTDTILEEGMQYIRQAAADNLQWEKHKFNNGYEIECEIPEEDILPVFNKLIEKYPELDLYASYSYDIREDDCSAQWWRTTHIETKHRPNGTTILHTSSSTHWF